MLLALLSHSDTAPYFCLKSRHSPEEIIFVSFDEANDATHLEILFPFEGTTLHGSKTLRDEEIKQNLDDIGIEYPSVQSACEFVAKLLRKGDFSVKQLQDHSFFLVLKESDGNDFEFAEFKRHDGSSPAISILKALVLPPLKSAKRMMLSTPATHSSSQSDVQEGDDLQVRNKKTAAVVTVETKKKKKMRA